MEGQEEGENEQAARRSQDTSARHADSCEIIHALGVTGNLSKVSHLAQGPTPLETAKRQPGEGLSRPP